MTSRFNADKMVVSFNVPPVLVIKFPVLSKLNVAPVVMLPWPIVALVIASIALVAMTYYNLYLAFIYALIMGLSFIWFMISHKEKKTSF